MPLQQQNNISRFEGLTLRAWVMFVGTTGAIVKSSNVSGVVRNSTGNWTITFTNAMSSANYAYDSATWDTTSAYNLITTTAGTRLAASLQLVRTEGGGAVDPEFMYAAVYE